jgi:PAS domain S-box-containing protein
MPDHSFEVLNLIANLVMIGGAVPIIYVMFQQRRLTRSIETAIAPKVGIENYLSMCAQIVEADPDGTCVVNDNGSIVLVNKRLEDISGYHRSELVGQSVEILVPLESRAVHVNHRDGFTLRPSARPMRGLVLRHKRGEQLAVEIRLNRYTDTTGGFTIAKVRVSE